MAGRAKRVERRRAASHSLTVRGFTFALVCALVFCVQMAEAGGRDSRPGPSPKPVSLTADELSRFVPAESTGLRREVLDLALRAYQCGRARGEIQRSRLTVIDYSLPSTQKRLWVIDLDRRKLLFNELVAHGRESGENTAVSFSNALGSHKSSLGLFRGDRTYVGQHGYSLNLAGLEPGINDHAMERRVVVHGADYVAPEFVARHGRLGRSLGCPALDRRVSRRVIDEIKDGGAVFAFYPDHNWLDRSSYLSCDAAGRPQPTRYARSTTTSR
jgi:hypothetical protein